MSAFRVCTVMPSNRMIRTFKRYFYIFSFVDLIRKWFSNVIRHFKADITDRLFDWWQKWRPRLIRPRRYQQGEVIPRCLSSTYINLNTYIDNLYKFKSYRTKVIVVCQNSMTQMEMSFILFLVNNLII